MKWIIALALCLALGSGCAMTRSMPDGSTVTVTVDGAQLDALIERVELYQRQRQVAEALGREEEAARLDARIADILATLRELGKAE